MIDSPVLIEVTQPIRYMGPVRRNLARALVATSLLWIGVLSVGSVDASPATRAAQSTMSVLGQTHWVAVGSTHPAHILYAFVDPNCPFCHDLWMELRPYYAHGLQVRFVLVGILSSTSPGKAAAILESPNPATALRLNEEKWKFGSDDSGGIAPLGRLSSADSQDLRMDEMLMQDFGIVGTPAIVYLDSSGAIHVVEGVPDKTTMDALVRSSRPPV